MFDIYEFSDQLQNVLSENERLRDENYRLRKENDEHMARIHCQYDAMQSQIGNILSGLIFKEQ